MMTWRIVVGVVLIVALGCVSGVRGYIGPAGQFRIGSRWWGVGWTPDTVQATLYAERAGIVKTLREVR